MITKELINQRFIKAVNFIISEKIAKNKTEISLKLNISKSKFSEILNERMSVSLEDLANFVSLYNISSDWILTEKGKILANFDSKQEDNKPENDLKDKIISLLESENERLKTELEDIKSYKTKPAKTN